MRALTIKPYVLRLFLAAFLLFIANKFLIRPLVLGSDSPAFLRTVVLSLPNTIEAIMGTTILTGLLAWARHRLRPRFDRVSDVWLALIGASIAGVYVLTQEFRVHDLGGRNVFDPYDAVGSIVGLILMAAVLARFGVLEDPRDDVRLA